MQSPLWSPIQATSFGRQAALITTMYPPASVDDHVIDDPARLVAHDAVEGTADLEASDVIGHQALNVVERACRR